MQIGVGVLSRRMQRMPANEYSDPIFPTAA
jgi:hypothetical protein